MIVTAYSTLREAADPQSPIALVRRRSRSDPALRPQLDGFCRYVESHGAKMTSQLFGVLEHIQRTRHELSIELDPADEGILGAWVLGINAITFWPDGSVRDPKGRVLVRSDGVAPDPDAIAPCPQDSEDRKARTMAELSPRGLKPISHLPTVIGEQEVELREPGEAAARCLALFAVAVRGESLVSGRPIPVSELRRRLPGAFAAFSSKEREFIGEDSFLSGLCAKLGKANAPDRQSIINAVWRYECVAVLLWALQISERLEFPETVASAAEIAGLVIGVDQQRFLRGARLRSSSEILDMLDLYYRLHWLTVQSRVDQSGSAGVLVPGVVSERHYALNWLVKYGDAEWDDVQTPT
jgi:hypothetical protein